MKPYRIRWNLWRVNGANRRDAAHELCDLMKKHPEQFFTLEDDEDFNDRKPLWKRFLTG